MGFKAVGSTPAPTPAAEPTKPAAPVARKRVVPAAVKAEPAAEIEKVATPASPGIVRRGPGALKAAAQPDVPAAGEGEAPAAVDDADPLSWAHSGDEAAAIAAAENARREAVQEERRARGYWPQQFELIPPGTASRTGPINDRYQADIILLDEKVGPSFWRHVLKNPRTGRWDVIEPCPKEFDNCPLDPPNGERESDYVGLISVLNINGYTVKTGDRAGTHIPITKELIMAHTGDQLFFHDLVKEHGSLRGIQLTMTRSSKSDSRIGIPSFVGKFTDDEIEAFIKSQGMWKIKETREGEKIDDEDWLMHKFNYAEFLHKPSGADLRQRYAGTAGGAPIGARSGSDPQWGQSRYAPGAATGPSGAAATGTAMDLDDDVPF